MGWGGITRFPGLRYQYGNRISAIFSVWWLGGWVGLIRYRIHSIRYDTACGMIPSARGWTCDGGLKTGLLQIERA